MRNITSFIVVACAMASGVVAAPHPRNRHHTATTTAAVAADTAAAGTAAAADTAAASGTVTRGAQTQVFFEVNGVPGNECLTFRNNGEMVDAACVNTAADRQITPSTLNGQQVLLVQRSFTADFRPDLVGVQACVGFNGTDYKAEPCGAAGVTPVTFVGGELHAGGSCASGHDGLAQLTVDLSGKTCATYTVTNVAATAP